MRVHVMHGSDLGSILYLKTHIDRFESKFPKFASSPLNLVANFHAFWTFSYHFESTSSIYIFLFFNHIAVYLDVLLINYFKVLKYESDDFRDHTLWNFNLRSLRLRRPS